MAPAPQLPATKISSTETTISLGNSIYDTGEEQYQWNAIAKSGSVLLIVATICTAVLAFLVQFDFLPFWALASLMALNTFFAFAAAGLWTAMAVYQAHIYSAVLGPVATDDSHAAAFGPGFYIIWVYFFCTLVLTPLMAHFTGLILLQLLVLLALLVIVATFVAVAMCHACMTSEVQVEEGGQKRSVSAVSYGLFGG